MLKGKVSWVSLSKRLFYFYPMNIILFDYQAYRENLLPFTFTRPVAAIRVGILTIKEKWEKYFPQAVVSYITQDYLQKKYPLQIDEDNILINASACPNKIFQLQIAQLRTGEALTEGSTPVALRLNKKQLALFLDSNYQPDYKFVDKTLTMITEVWHIFQYNAAEIKADFDLLTAGRESQPVNDPFTKIYGKDNLFVEKGAGIRAAIIDAESGPVYIGKDARVHEGAIIKGSFALCEGAHVNIGAKIKGDTTIGPFSKVGGEISNAVIFGFSNKGHDGFLGNSVLGEWCNLGADTNTSNLKNNYAPVKLWNYQKGGFKNTGLQFCGLMMGDHSKSGINTMFNTGTVVGVSANIFGDGFPRNFIPSFAWGGAAGFSTFALNKAYEVAEKVMERRKVLFDDAEKRILQHLYEISAAERNWEKKA